MSFLRYLCLFAYSGVQHILCRGFVFLSSRCVPYVSLDCPFLIAPSVFSNVYLQELLISRLVRSGCFITRCK